MTTSPYNNKTGEITGGFKPPFRQERFPHAFCVEDSNGVEFAMCESRDRAKLLSELLNEYCEMKKAETEAYDNVGVTMNLVRAEELSNKMSKANPQHERREG